MPQMRLPDFLLPPTAASYEQTQKARLLYVMLLATFFGAVFIGVGNFNPVIRSDVRFRDPADRSGHARKTHARRIFSQGVGIHEMAGF